MAGTGTTQDCGALNQLADWYDHTFDPKAIIVSTMKLYDNGRGGYVNQYDETTEQIQDCDDGNFIEDDGCPASCRELVIL